MTFSEDLNTVLWLLTSTSDIFIIVAISDQYSIRASCKFEFLGKF